MRVVVVEASGSEPEPWVVELEPPAPLEPSESGARSFEDVFRADHRAIVAIAWALTGSRAVAEELTQEAFLKAHQRWPRIGSYDDWSSPTKTR